MMKLGAEDNTGRFERRASALPIATVVLALLLLLAALVSTAALGQSLRADVYRGEDLAVRQIQVVKTPDGPFELVVCASVRGDKGAALESCERVVVRKGKTHKALEELYAGASSAWLALQKFPGVDGGAFDGEPDAGVDGGP